MAPRKATKHSDTEMVEKTAEAGDVSPPKRKKTAMKIANKSEEKKEMRLPRAAKSGKTDSTEIAEPTLVTASTKNVKNKGKTVAPKSSTTAAKTNSKKVTRRGKDMNEEVDAKTQNTDVVEAVEEVQIRKSRAKTATKKAGMEIEEEAGAKSKKRPKKDAVVIDAEKLEEPMTKQRKNMENVDAAATSDKPKPKKTKKQPNKVTATKTKSVSSNDNSNADKTEELTVMQTSRQPTARNTRGRKNGNVDKTAGEAVLEQDSKENQEAQNDHLDSMESIKPPKKGRNVRKKDEGVPQKDTVYHNENKNDNDTTEKSDVPPPKNKKLINNKSTSTLPTVRKTRGRKMEASHETSPENDQDSKITGEVLLEQDSDENQKAQTDAAAIVEVIQEAKKGRNVKKMDESMPQKNNMKKRGKAASADTAAAPDGTDIEKSVNDSLKKVKEGKENETLTSVDDNAGRRMHLEDTSISENQTVTLVTNNNMQKLSEPNEDGKESRTLLEKNSGKHKEVSETDEKHLEETLTTIAEDNV